MSKAARTEDRDPTPASVPQTWKQGRVQSSPLNRSKRRIVMKTRCASCARRGECCSDVIYGSRATPSPREARWRLPSFFPPPFFSNVRRPTTSFQRRLSGGGETDPEGLPSTEEATSDGRSLPGRCVGEDFHEWDTNETLPTTLISQAIETSQFLMRSRGR